VFDESTKSEVSQWNLNGIENFLSSFPQQVGAKLDLWWSRSNLFIFSHVKFLWTMR